MDPHLLLLLLPCISVVWWLLTDEDEPRARSH